MTTQIYKGRYNNPGDIMFTFDEKHIYNGRFTNSSDIMLTLSGHLP